MYDFHVHSCYSPDSFQTIDEVCISAIKNGICGIAVCDHVDLWFCEELHTCEKMQACIADVQKARGTYGDQLQIYQGIELAEYLFDTQEAERILGLTDYDVILGSVHSLVYEDWTDSYSRLDFGTQITEEKLKGFLLRYFECILQMVDKTDFDILSHLTCPLRYINGKYKRNIDILHFKKEIFYIFEQIISKDISLEINTSGLSSGWGQLMPEIDLIKHYYQMGGRLITVGSDAHTPDKIGSCFKKTSEILRDIGFRENYYFKQRSIQSCEL